MLLQKIQAASLEARKAKDALKASLLVTLCAEAARVGKDAGNRESTDAEVVAVVAKFIKNIDATLDVVTDEAARQKAQAERLVLVDYMPKAVAGAELQAAIAEIVAQLAERTPKAMGAVMKALKDKLGGAYDGAEASTLVRQALA